MQYSTVLCRGNSALHLRVTRSRNAILHFTGLSACIIRWSHTMNDFRNNFMQALLSTRPLGQGMMHSRDSYRQQDVSRHGAYRPLSTFHRCLFVATLDLDIHMQRRNSVTNVLQEYPGRPQYGFAHLSPGTAGHPKTVPTSPQQYRPFHNATVVNTASTCSPGYRHDFKHPEKELPFATQTLPARSLRCKSRHLI